MTHVKVKSRPTVALFDDVVSAKPETNRYLSIIMYMFEFIQLINNDVYRVNILSNPFSQCWADFECFHYLNIRTALFNNLSQLPTDCSVVSRLLICGNAKLTYDQNVDIFN